MNVTSLLVQVLVGMVVSVPALWIVGRWRVGPERAKFTDAIWISALGTIANAALGTVIGGGIGSLLQLVINLYLIKKYYEASWGDAVIISIVAVILVVVAGMVLAVVGFSLI